MNTTGSRLSKANRVSVQVLYALCALIVLATGYAATHRLISVIRGAFPVEVTLNDTRTSLTINETSIGADLGSMTVTAPPLSGVGLVTAALEPILVFITIAIIVVSAVMLTQRLQRGLVFGAPSTALVATIGLTALVGFTLAAVCRGITGAETLTALAGNAALPHATLLTVNPAVMVVGAVLTATLTTAFSVGARLQRDTEGLI